MPNIIDHIDGNKENNTITNIRSCTQQQNMFNKTKSINNKSGYKGVDWNCNKWRVRIMIKNKEIYIGSFDCIKEASKAYEAKAKELFGEYYSGSN